MPFLLMLLPLILPPVVKIAEKKFIGSEPLGQVKKQWVIEFLLDIWAVLDARVPFWKHLAPIKDSTIEILSLKIDKEVEKLKTKGQLSAIK